MKINKQQYMVNKKLTNEVHAMNYNSTFASAAPNNANFTITKILPLLKGTCVIQTQDCNSKLCSDVKWCNVLENNRALLQWDQMKPNLCMWMQESCLLNKIN